MSEVGNVYGGRIIPALRYRNGAAAIDWLCAAFGFERKMVVPAVAVGSPMPSSRLATA